MTEQTTEQDWIRKIAALLAKAEKTDSEHEAAAFFAKANELMLNHAIDEARVRHGVLKAQGGAKVEQPVQVYWMWATHDAHAKAKVTLIEKISKSQHVVFKNFPNRPHENMRREGNEGKYSQWGSLVGYAQDIENVKLLYTSMLIQWTRFVRKDVQTWKAAPKAERMWWEEETKEYGFKTGHLEGFAIRVGERLHKQEEEVLTAANANALMVNKDAMIRSWMEEKEGPRYEWCFAIQPTEQLKRKNSTPLWCIMRKGHEPDPKTIDGHRYTWKPVYRSSGGGRRDVDAKGFSAGQAAGSLADIGTPRTKIGQG